MAKIFIKIIILSFIIIPLSAQEVEKSKSLSPIIKSLILPGSGEYALGNPSRGRTFVISEIALIFSVVSVYHFSSFNEQKYIAFAAEHSGAQPKGKDHHYWVDIGNYISIKEFNEEHLRFRENDALYEETEEWIWEWDTDDNRSTFESTRIKSDIWKLGGKFLIGGLVVNHIVSAIDALYLTRISNLNNVLLIPTIDPVQESVGFQLSWSLPR